MNPWNFPVQTFLKINFSFSICFSPTRVEYYFKNYPGYEITQTKTFIKVVTNYFLLVYAFLNRVQSQYKVVCMHTGILSGYNFVPLKTTPFTELQEATKKSSKVKNSTLKKKKIKRRVCSDLAEDWKTLSHSSWKMIARATILLAEKVKLKD